jgi:hypothetical protein
MEDGIEHPFAFPAANNDRPGGLILKGRYEFLESNIGLQTPIAFMASLRVVAQSRAG